MSIDWTLYERKLKINGNTTRDRQINLMKDGILNNFNNSPSFRSAYFNGSTTATDIQIIDSDKYYIKTIQMKPNEVIDVGDLIVFDSKTWLCTEVDKTNPVFQYGKVYLSTQTITIYKNNTSYQIPCVIQSGIKTSQLGTDENTYIEMPSSTITMRLPNTAITRLIARDEVYKIGTQSYSIKDLNDIIEPGLLVAELKFSAESVVNHIYTVDIQNSDATLYVNDTLTLDVICTDNSQQVTSPTLTYQSSNTEVATISNGVLTCIAEGTTVITVTFNGISDTLNLTVQTEQIQDNYTVSITGDTLVKLNSNITLNASVYNNGVLDSSKSVVWNVSNQDESSNSYITIVSQDGGSITLKATNNSSYVGKYVVVRVSKSDDGSVYSEYVVQIKPLF
ncbi:MAG: hypothetical protein LLF98_02110 [Clostridium sp.]|uniref:Ig-like domain-containing protein n=1 Tax=Clostridium sp. TaxID=1506 RepID=UPI0025C60B59|nr:hypothetical protein [Clostridium sp.]MCE5220076.1 hypothetical protein [Clostridium sp.]